MEYNQQVKNRPRRIEGQLKGVLSMMEQEKDCRDVVTQLSAARSAIDRTMGAIVSSNLEQCVGESLAARRANGRFSDKKLYSY